MKCTKSWYLRWHVSQTFFSSFCFPQDYSTLDFTGTSCSTAVEGKPHYWNKKINYVDFDSFKQAEAGKWEIKNGFRPTSRKYGISELTIRRTIYFYKQAAADEQAAIIFFILWLLCNCKRYKTFASWAK